MYKNINKFCKNQILPFFCQELVNDFENWISKYPIGTIFLSNNNNFGSFKKYIFTWRFKGYFTLYSEIYLKMEREMFDSEFIPYFNSQKYVSLFDIKTMENKIIIGSLFPKGTFSYQLLCDIKFNKIYKKILNDLAIEYKLSQDIENIILAFMGYNIKYLKL